MNLNKISDRHPTISTSGERQAYAKGYNDAADEYTATIEAMLDNLREVYGEGIEMTDAWREWMAN